MTPSSLSWSVMLPLSVAFTSSVALGCKSKQLSASTEKPNVVLILIDDMGWRDLACYGSTYHQTPNIDRLAKQGVMFTNGYASCTVCSPSRASILTGKNPAVLRITDWIEGHKFPFAKLNVPDWTMFLDSTQFTIARAFKSAGYSTCHIGKWHQGETPEYWPENHGFEQNIGGWAKGSPNKNSELGSNGYFSPYGNPRLTDGEKGEYLTERLADEAVNYIEKHTRTPFFLNLWFYNVHTPLQAKQEKIDKYAALTDPNGLQSNATYAAMVEHVDDAVGKIVSQLENLGLMENTIIVFTSDNGGLIGNKQNRVTNNYPLRDGKGQAYEGGVRVPFFMVGPGIEKNKTSDIPVTSADILPTLNALANLKVEGKFSREWNGTDVSAILKGSNNMPERPLVWHYPHYHSEGATPYSAIRWGDFKLIHFYENDAFELYNIKQDIGEQNNLVLSHQNQFNKLKDELKKILTSYNVQYPTPNPNFDPERPRRKK